MVEKPSDKTQPQLCATTDGSVVQRESDPLVPRKGKSEASWGEMCRITVYLMGWYGFNVLYNIDNKAALNMLPLPVTISVVQLLIGWFFFIPVWGSGYKKHPRFNSVYLFVVGVVPQGLCHLVVHLFAVVSLGLGAVSFTHIVKACEPVLTSIFSAVIFKKIASVWSYLTLVPIIGGVAIASATELSFTWTSFTCAMISNVGSAGRAIYTKKVMEKDRDTIATSLDAYNLYAVVTIIATIPGILIALVCEGPIVASTWRDAVAIPAESSDGSVSFDIVCSVIRSAIWYFLYNVLAFFSLEKLDQVSHAIANTLKRVVVIVSAVIFFGTPLSFLGAMGSGIAIAGTFLYSLSKSKEKERGTSRLPR